MKEDWLESRKGGIGGSDAPAVCGVSKWKTPYQVWKEKRGEAEPTPDNPAMFWGRTLEPVIRQRYADVTGREVMVPDKILVHPELNWMIASVDGIAEGGRVLEVKTARSLDGWGEDGSADIPEAYLVQVQHYMVVTHLPVADVAALIGGQDFRIYEVPADKELQELIIEREAAFWELVQRGEPPEAMSYADLRQKFKVSKAVKVQADASVLAALSELKAIKELKDREEELEAAIMAHLGEADTLVDGEQVLATWKAGKPPKRFDAKEFQKNNPVLYEQYLKEGEASRRLLIK